LLSKYGKEVPKTWDELISTAKDILKKERELNNTELIGYNGMANGIKQIENKNTL